MKPIRSIVTGVLLFSFLVVSGCSRGGERTVSTLDQNQFSTLFTYHSETGAWEYRGTQPAVVLFYDSGRDSSRLFVECLQAISTAYQNQIDFFQADIGISGDIPDRLRVGGVPTYLFIPLQGEPISISGFRSKAALESDIARYLLPKE